jgi:NAD-dependent DNA ligase
VVVDDQVWNPFFAPGRGLHFALAGEALVPRCEAGRLAAAVRWHGGEVDARVNAGTDVLLAGRWASEQVERARELGVEVFRHFQVLRFLRR